MSLNPFVCLLSLEGKVRKCCIFLEDALPLVLLGDEQSRSFCLED